MEYLKDKFFYKGKRLDVTIPIVIAHTVDVIAQQLGTDFDTEYEKFLASKTYQALQNPATAMFAENAEFIADEYFRETGILQYPDNSNSNIL